MNEFDQYKKLGEPGALKKAENWRVAIGLQQVDGLTPSRYLIEIAKQNIEGRISIDDAGKQITQYYKKNPAKTIVEKGKKEADEVSARIVKLLSNKAFSFSPAEYIAIHKFLFTGVLSAKIAGKIRDYDISKEEPVLNGDSVSYCRSDSIWETLNFDFAQEKAFTYKGLSKRETAEHIAKFASGIWQIHPFGEGNTRTTAVFIIKYLRTLGFKADNELFEENSRYFRDALARANYNNHEKNIHDTMEYVNRFFGNLLLGANHALDFREVRVGFVDTVNDTASPRGDTVNDTVNPRGDTVFSLMAKDNKITAVKLAASLGVSVITVKREIKRLKNNGIIERIGSDKTGAWKVLIK